MAVAESTITRRVVERASTGERVGELLFRAALVLCLLVGVVFLGVLLVDVAADGVGLLSGSFLTEYPSRVRTEG